MSCSRRSVLLAGLFAAGCGFRPLYGPGGGGDDLAGQVSLEGVSGRLGYAFRDRLRRRLGEPGPDPRYVLDVAISTAQEGLLISRTDDVTRFDVEGIARFTLRRRADGVAVSEGVARSVSAYSTLASPYATRIAERDAERRVAEDLAERVFARIAALPVRGPAEAPFPPDPEA